VRGLRLRLGLIKSRRIVADECLEEGNERTDYLAKVDRSIRDLQSAIDQLFQICRSEIALPLRAHGHPVRQAKRWVRACAGTNGG